MRARTAIAVSAQPLLAPATLARVTEPPQPHLLLVAWGFPPGRSGGVYRALALANAFAADGWQVTVLTAPRDIFVRYTGTDPTLESPGRPAGHRGAGAVPLGGPGDRPAPLLLAAGAGTGPVAAGARPARPGALPGERVRPVAARAGAGGAGRARPSTRSTWCWRRRTRTSPSPPRGGCTARPGPVRPGLPGRLAAGRVHRRAAARPAQQGGPVGAPARRFGRGGVVRQRADPGLARGCVPGRRRPHARGGQRLRRRRCPRRSTPRSSRERAREGGVAAPARLRLRRDRHAQGPAGGAVRRLGAGPRERTGAGRRAGPAARLPRLLPHPAGGDARPRRGRHARVSYEGPVGRTSRRRSTPGFDALLLVLGAGRYVTSGKVYEYLATGLPIVSVHDPGNAVADVLPGTRCGSRSRTCPRRRSPRRSPTARGRRRADPAERAAALSYARWVPAGPPARAAPGRAPRAGGPPAHGCARRGGAVVIVLLFSAGRRAQPTRTVQAVAALSATATPGGDDFVLVSWHAPGEDLAAAVGEVVVVGPAGVGTQTRTGQASLPTKILGRLRDPGRLWRAARRDPRVRELVGARRDARGVGHTRHADRLAARQGQPRARGGAGVRRRGRPARRRPRRGRPGPRGPVKSGVCRRSLGLARADPWESSREQPCERSRDDVSGPRVSRPAPTPTATGSTSTPRTRPASPRYGRTCASSGGAVGSRTSCPAPTRRRTTSTARSARSGSCSTRCCWGSCTSC